MQRDEGAAGLNRAGKQGTTDLVVVNVAAATDLTLAG